MMKIDLSFLVTPTLTRQAFGTTATPPKVSSYLAAPTKLKTSASRPSVGMSYRPAEAILFEFFVPMSLSNPSPDICALATYCSFKEVLGAPSHSEFSTNEFSTSAQSLGTSELSAIMRSQRI